MRASKAKGWQATFLWEQVQYNWTSCAFWNPPSCNRLLSSHGHEKCNHLSGEKSGLDSRFRGQTEGGNCREQPLSILAHNKGIAELLAGLYLCPHGNISSPLLSSGYIADNHTILMERCLFTDATSVTWRREGLVLRNPMFSSLSECISLMGKGSTFPILSAHIDFPGFCSWEGKIYVCFYIGNVKFQFLEGRWEGGEKPSNVLGSNEV